MEDVQNRIDTRKIDINKVGIKGIRHPFAIQNRDGSLQHTVGTFNMYVDLPHDQKGTHMSRFVALLNEECSQLGTDTFGQTLANMTQRLEEKTGFIELSFPFFIRKKAPVSGVESMLDYEVSLQGSWSNGKTDLLTIITIPVTSLCPCSKKISDYGAHNQRSHITLSIRSEPQVTIEELIELAEKEASSEIFALLKRPDEKQITEQAYDNPKFVEDIVRDIANDLNNDERIHYYKVETENFESIHNHSAYALIERDKKAQ
jgi:GTP cyclohydrolase I